jgi:hypothetical protein
MRIGLIFLSLRCMGSAVVNCLDKSTIYINNYVYYLGVTVIITVIYLTTDLGALACLLACYKRGRRFDPRAVQKLVCMILSLYWVWVFLCL